MADMGALKMDLLGAILSGAKEADATQKKRAALLPSFETEEAALKYARRIASLRPGDMVKCINADDTGLAPAVFAGFDMSSQPAAIVLRYDTDKQLCIVKMALHAVVVD